MLHRLALVPLAPLLVVQGRRVRRVTPRLPEAPGERAGVAGSGPPLRLLVVGDSAAAGVGAASQTEALTGRTVAALADRHTVHWTLVARAELSTRPLPPADVVVTSIGVNDVTSLRTPRAWLADVAALVRMLRDRTGARRVLLSGLPPMHRFPALPQPLRWQLGAVARELDRALARWAPGVDGCEHVPVAFTIDPAHMAADGFHPGPPVYAAWGAEIARRIVGDG